MEANIIKYARSFTCFYIWGLVAIMLNLSTMTKVLYISIL